MIINLATPSGDCQIWNNMFQKISGRPPGSIRRLSLKTFIAKTQNFLISPDRHLLDCPISTVQISASGSGRSADAEADGRGGTLELRKDRAEPYLRETAKEVFVTVDENGRSLLDKNVEFRWRD
jgi:hypothetical protein